MGVNCVNVTSNDNLQETKRPMQETHDKEAQLTPPLTHTRKSSGSHNKEMHNIISRQLGNAQHYLWKYVVTEIEKPLCKV